MADEYAALLVSDRVKAAVALLEEPENAILSLRIAAKICNVHHSSISARMKGFSKPKAEENTSRQLLTPAEEKALVKWAKQFQS
jgi:hypothetical protein